MSATSAWDCHRPDPYDDGPVVRCHNCDWVSLTPEQVLALADRLTAAVLDRYAAVCEGPFDSGSER